MPDPSLLAPSAVTIPGPELHDAVVLDNATARGQEVRCTIESLDPLLATDPMPWEPYMTAEGEFWPKKGDRAVVSTRGRPRNIGPDNSTASTGGPHTGFEEVIDAEVVEELPPPTESEMHSRNA